MKKRFFLLLLTLLVTACSEQEELVRVDVQKVIKEGNYEEAFMISDKEKVKLLNVIFEKVKWEPNTEAKMARYEDVLATLFYQYDLNMPERLYEYKIWFNEDNSATIISNKEEEGYGRLKNAKELKKNLLD